jgi:hypothetical protein
MATDWSGWHRAYDDPTSVQSRRLVVVRRRVGESLDALGGAPGGVLSLCAGEARDLIPVLAVRPQPSPETLLVEASAELADAAHASARAAGLARVTLRVADAGLRVSYADVLPVDLLLLCGIFGNVSAPDIHRSISSTPRMLRPGGVVIWTRGRLEGDDLRPTLRRWFVEAGFEEVAYDGEPEPYGVGVARWARPTQADGELPERLFTFLR